MSGKPMTDAPTPYVPEEGAGIYRLCDVPEGWEWRVGPDDNWGVGASKSAVIVEARPPRPVMVEVSADEVIEALGVRPLGRDPLLGATEGGDARQRLLDAAWAAKDAAS